jgi:adenylylsulfate kinase
LPAGHQLKTTQLEHNDMEALPVDENVVWHVHAVTQQDRERQHGHQGVVLWFTGLSGSGKSTLAGALEQALLVNGVSTYLLDGDNVRHGLCCDLGFSDPDRRENIRRVGEVAKLMVDAGLVVLTAFISPHRAERKMVRDMLKYLSIHRWLFAKLVILKAYIKKPVPVSLKILQVSTRFMNRLNTLIFTCRVNN